MLEEGYQEYTKMAIQHSVNTNKKEMSELSRKIEIQLDRALSLEGKIDVSLAHPDKMAEARKSKLARNVSKYFN